MNNTHQLSVREPLYFLPLGNIGRSLAASAVESMTAGAGGSKKSGTVVAICVGSGRRSLRHRPRAKRETRSSYQQDGAL